jgi:hypothetical protein
MIDKYISNIFINKIIDNLDNQNNNPDNNNIDSNLDNSDKLDKILIKQKKHKIIQYNLIISLL